MNAIRGEQRTSRELAAEHTIEDMLKALRQAAINEAYGLEALEIEAARRPHPVLSRTIEEVRQHGTALGAAHALLYRLARHEDAVAALLNGTD